MVKKTIVRSIEVEYPVSFQCDVCGTIVDVINPMEYWLKYDSNIEKNFAVLKYSTPSGGFSSDLTYHEVHCCSSSCLCRALKRVPFTAEITIPSSKYFTK